jgi:immune inhibitor A
MRVLPRSAFALGLFLLACSDSTTAPPVSDAGPYPYHRSATGVRTTGTNRILILPAQFSNGAPPRVAASEIAARYFGGTNGGAVAETYRLASRGMFTLRGEVAPWSRAPSPLTSDSAYVLGAINAADPRIDFGRFDNDGPDGFPNSGDDDGVVDGGVVVMNSDRDAYCDTGPGRGPHPHTNIRWLTTARTPFLTNDAKFGGGRIGVSGYVLMSALACDGQSTNSTGLAHELGHLLFGLPDLYHSVGGSGQAWEIRRWVVGCWELMAAGSIWGCGHGQPNYSAGFTSSATFGAWTRTQIGWVTPTPVLPNRDSVYTLSAMGVGATVLQIPISPGEYLLMEYREPEAGDRTPPAAGVLIYHIAESLPLYPSVDAPRQYRVSLIEADDDGALLRTEAEGGDRGVSEDAFGISRSELRPGIHSEAKGVDGAPFPFVISEITLDRVTHLARMRISPR